MRQQAMGAILQGLQAPGANLARLDLRKAKLAGANLRGADLSRALLDEMVSGPVRLDEANLAGASLCRAKLANASLGGAILTGADLSDDSLLQAWASKADFSGARLAGADLSMADLSEARLIDADLTHAKLNRTVLLGADLSGAHLSGAVLAQAQLMSACLAGVDLSRVDLSLANLNFANLRGANALRHEPVRSPAGPHRFHRRAPMRCAVGQFYDYSPRQRPTDAEIAAHLPQINYRHVVLESAGRTIRFTMPGTRINLGGIAKGYSVERVIALLRAQGVTNAFATAGGDTRLLGDRRGRPWVIGIRDPDDAQKLITNLSLEDEAISTSGDYERFFDEGKERHHHILDPRTGKSAKGVRSVTVVGPDAVMTEGLTKTVFIKGPEQGLALIDSLGDYETVIVDDRRRVLFSKGLKPGR